MGRKGVSKRKKPKEKAALVHGHVSSLAGQKAESQPETVTEKAKVMPKGNQKR